MAERQYVSKKNESVRMFKSDFMEFFSHVHPATPLVLYIPLVVYMLYAAFWQSRLSVLAVAALFVVVSIPLAVIFWLFFGLTLGRFASAVSAGFAFGYVCYDSIHYAIHHFPMKRGIWLSLKQYHLRHHFHDDHAGYGVSSPLWDYVFRTTRK